MKRFVALLSAAVLLFGMSALAQQTGKAKTLSMAGEVKTVSASSLTIEGGGKSMTFNVTPATHLLAKGSTSKTKQKQAAGAPGLTITDMVKPGSRVVVRYQGSDAVEVRVR